VENKMGEAKVKEQNRQELIEEFSKDPDVWVKKEDLLLAVFKKTDVNGAEYYGTLNNCRNVKDLALGVFHVEESVQNRRDYIRLQQQKQAHGGLVLPGYPSGMGGPLTAGGNGRG